MNTIRCLASFAGVVLIGCQATQSPSGGATAGNRSAENDDVYVPLPEEEAPPPPMEEPEPQIIDTSSPCWCYTQDQVDVMVHVVTAGLLNGWLYQDSILATYDTCLDVYADSDRLDCCLTCSTFIVDEVYTDEVYAVEYPRAVTEPTLGCNTLCIQYTPDSRLFCDSDCDGWFDEIELKYGYDRCDWYDPPYYPNAPATVCQELSRLRRIEPVVSECGPSEVLEAQDRQMRERDLEFAVE